MFVIGCGLSTYIKDMIDWLIDWLIDTVTTYNMGWQTIPNIIITTS